MTNTDKISELMNYQGYSRSNECKLDGRYFGIVCNKYAGVMKHPIEIYIKPKSVMLRVREIVYDYSVLTVARVTIFGANVKHSSVLFVDSSKRTVELWDPIEPGMLDNYVKQIKNAVQYQLVPEGFTFQYTPAYFIPEFSKSCSIGHRGYCNAYVLREALHRILDIDSDVSGDIRSFITAVEENYSSKLTGTPDIEYGFGSFLAGALVGGVLVDKTTRK